MKDASLGIGIIGYSIGRIHAHAWQGVKEYYHPARLVPKLVAIAGRNLDRTNLEASRFGFKRAYDDWHKLVRDPEVDVVDNCAPPYLHAEATVQAAEAGKHLVCEKPMARNAKEAKDMLAAADKARVKHMVGYNYRFLSSVAYAKQMITGGVIGKIRYYKGSYLNSTSGYSSDKAPMDWHHTSKMAGYGALGDLGTHAIDMARFLAGEVDSVSALSATYVKKRPVTKGSKKLAAVDVDDVTIATMKFRSGAIGTLEAAWVTPGRTDYLAFEVFGSKGSIKFNLERLGELEVFVEGADPKYDGPRTVQVMAREHPFMAYFQPLQAGGFSWEHTFVNELNHFAVCVAEDKPISPQGATFEDGYRNCLIMDAMMESSASGRRVSLPG